jgi:hypothetical protein
MLSPSSARRNVSRRAGPDAAATASQSKILECSTGDFAVQANLFAERRSRAQRPA